MDQHDAYQRGYLTGEVFRLGYAAGMTGQARDGGPFHPTEPLRAEWLRGYDAGRADAGADPLWVSWLNIALWLVSYLVCMIGAIESARRNLPGGIVAGIGGACASLAICTGAIIRATRRRH